MHPFSFRSENRTPERLLAALAATALLGGAAGAQLSHEPGPNSGLVQVEAEPYGPELDTTSGETEGDMNCFEVVFARSGLRAIVQNFPDMGEGFLQNQRTLAKWLTREVVFRPGNAIHSYYEAGEVYGIEFDWFFPVPGGMVRPSLPRAVDVELLGRGDEPSLFAKVYGFGQGEYVAYRTAVEAVIGHPMDAYVVWEPETLCVGSARLRLAGEQNLLQGPAMAGGDVELVGAGNALHGPLWLAGRFRRLEGNRVGFVGRRETVPAPAFAGSLAALRSEAIASGTYFPGDALLSGVAPPAGVVFAEGNLVLAADGWSGDWTLVSASGSVELAGDDLSLLPSGSTVAAVAFGGDVRVLGNRAQVVGELHAPQGTLDVQGSWNTLLGAFTGVGATLRGEGNLMSDGTRLRDPSTR